MAETGMSFREVPQNRTFPLKCKEIALSTGGAAGCLQDQKLPETAGGYAYRDSGCIGAPSRNRFIYWRTHEDVLELSEESLDVNLTGNHLRVRFQGAPILNGVSIHEAHSYVVILVATVSSVHRLMFPHPNKIHKYDRGFMQGHQKNAASILSDAALASARDHTNSYLLMSTAGTVYRVHTAAAWLTNDGEGLFALATNTGSVLLIKLPPYGIQGVITQQELKQSSVMQRLWTGLVPAAIRGGAESSMTVMSLVIHPLGQDIFIFSVSYDHKIRMWSTKTHDCVMTADMLDYIPDNIDATKLPIGGKGHKLCKATGSTSQSVILSAFLSFTDRNQFCVFRPVLADGVYQLNHLTTVFGSNEDLVDFCITPSHLWTLWTGSDGEATARVAPIAPELLQVEDWLPVFMEPADRTELDVLPHQDPRQTYLEYIFYPGRFSTYAIVRALKTYRRSLESAANLDLNVSRDVLMADVSAAVEHEIQVAASEYELVEDEYHQLQMQQWARLYSCCTQYKQVGLKALGVFADANTGLVCVVRKSCASFVRPTHVLEHLYLTPAGTCNLDNGSGQTAIGEDSGMCRDVARLCDCLKLLGECLTPAMEMACEQDLYHTQGADVITQQVVRALITEASLGEATVAQTLQDLEVNLHTIQDVGRAAECLLNLLDLAQGHPENLALGVEMVINSLLASFELISPRMQLPVYAADNSGCLLMEQQLIFTLILIAVVRETDAGRQLNCSHLFASRLAAETLSKVVDQIAETSLHLSRDLLLLLTLVVTIGEQANVSLAMSEQIRSELINRVAMVVPQYFVLRWCAQTVVTPVTNTTKEINARQLEALDFSESTAVTMADPNIESGTTLMEQFFRGYGGVEVRAHMSTYSLLDDDPCALWSGGLVPACTVLSQLVWPVSANFGFAKFLLVSCQYTRLQEYVRLTRDWCDWNEASRRFMLAFAYLNTEEPYKALDQFVETVHGVSKDAFLKSLVPDTFTNPRHAEVVFVLKVIQLFEFFSLPHLAVSLASTAIMIADEDDPNLPTLWSKVFKHQLELGHNDEAYDALVSNPDPTRRKDCLRQLVVVLCERGQLQTLVQFPYIDLHDEVVGILESRARAVDLTAQNYYDLLYSFHIFRGNYRKAGSVMYEYGLRLGREVSGLKGLQRQAKCYLAALNALRLVDPKYAWIIQPGAPNRLRNSESEEMETMSSPKHSWDGEELDEQSERSIEVLELSDLEREYLLVHARLRLLQKDPDPAHMAGPTASAADTVALLVNAGLFDCAVNISRMFKLPLTQVYEGMASRCVRLARASAHFQQGDNEVTAQAWSWLEDNDLGGIGSNADVSSADQAWKLLQTYLERHPDKATRHHKAVALKLLSENFTLPNWFIAAYKRLNAAELLRLYLDFDQLEEAGDLTLEYIDAVLGCGAEYFGLKSCLSFTSPSVWLPYTCIDQLMIGLREGDSNATYRQLYDKVEKKLAKYHDTVESISRDVVLAAQQRVKLNQFSQRSHGMDMMES